MASGDLIRQAAVRLMMVGEPSEGTPPILSAAVTELIDRLSTLGRRHLDLGSAITCTSDADCQTGSAAALSLHPELNRCPGPGASCEIFFGPQRVNFLPEGLEIVLAESLDSVEGPRLQMLSTELCRVGRNRTAERFAMTPQFVSQGTTQTVRGPEPPRSCP